MKRLIFVSLLGLFAFTIILISGKNAQAYENQFVGYTCFEIVEVCDPVSKEDCRMEKKRYTFEMPLGKFNSVKEEIDYARKACTDAGLGFTGPNSEFGPTV